MVYKKYIKRGGKVYGPYLYESRRVGNKVVTKYVGCDKESEKRKKKKEKTAYRSKITRSIVSLIFIFAVFGGVLFFGFKYSKSLEGYAIYDFGRFDNSSGLSDWYESETSSFGDFMDNSPDSTTYLSGGGSLSGMTLNGSGINWTGEYVSIQTPSLGPGVEVWISFSWRKSYTGNESASNQMYVVLERPDSQTRELWRDDTKAWNSWRAESLNISDRFNQNGVYNIQLHCDLKNPSGEGILSNTTSICWFDEVVLDVRSDLYGYHAEFSNFTENPVNGTKYAPDRKYVFNATIVKTNKTAGIKFVEATKFLDRIYPAVEYDSNKYFVSLSGLSAGKYKYAWWTYANGTNNEYTMSDVSYYEIVRGAGEINTFINGERKNKGVVKGTPVTLNVSLPFDHGMTYRNLYVDGKLFGRMNKDFGNITVFNSVGIHNISGLVEETNNFTHKWETWWLVVADSEENLSTFTETPLITIKSPKEDTYIPETRKLDFVVESNIDLGSCTYNFDSEVGNKDKGFAGISDGLVLSYHFNREEDFGETDRYIADFSGKNIAASAFPKTKHSDNGKIAGAWEFLGDKLNGESYVLSSKALETPLDSGFSVSFLVNILGRDFSDEQDIIRTINLSSSQGFVIKYVKNSNTDDIYYGVGSKSSLYSGGTRSLSNKWAHVVLTYESKKGLAKLYLNGNLVHETVFDGPLVGLSSQIAIGGYQSKNGLKGLIDEVAVWKRPLESSEIMQIFNSQVPGTMDISSDLKQAFVKSVPVSAKTHRLWVSCRNLNGEIIYAPLKRTFSIASGLLNDEKEQTGEEAKENISEEEYSGCKPDWKCTKWSKCKGNIGSSVGKLIEGKLVIEGERQRICTDLNKCNNSVIERIKCNLRLPIETEKRKWCGEDYVGVFDVSQDKKELVGRIKQRTYENKKRIDVGFVIGGFEDYCDHCYNNVQDFDEDGIDCGGADCGACLLESPASASVFNLIKSVFIVLLLSAVFSLLFHYAYLRRKEKPKTIRKELKKQNIEMKKDRLKKGAAQIVLEARKKSYPDSEIKELLREEGLSEKDIDDVFKIADEG